MKLIKEVISLLHVVVDTNFLIVVYKLLSLYICKISKFVIEYLEQYFAFRITIRILIKILNYINIETG